MTEQISKIYKYEKVRVEFNGRLILSIITRVGSLLQAEKKKNLSKNRDVLRNWDGVGEDGC